VEDKVESQRAEEYRRMEARRKDKGQALLQGLQALFTRNGSNVEGRYVAFEEPLDATTVTRAVLDAARQHQCNTVVVGRHAFAGLKRWFQHHVAENLVRAESGISVWVVE
jgi:nucleotide-binding universal stress UspA family protein